ILSRAQLLQVVRELRGVMNVDLEQLLLANRRALVRQRMVPAGRADFRIRAAAELAADHEGDDARQVALISEYLQVEHQSRMLLERSRNAGRLIEHRQLPRTLRFSVLDTSFDIADCFDVLVQFRAVARAESLPQRRDLVADRIENAPVSLHAREPETR